VRGGVDIFRFDLGVWGASVRRKVLGLGWRARWVHVSFSVRGGGLGVVRCVSMCLRFAILFWGVWGGGGGFGR
jgi:hypothetical protein